MNVADLVRALEAIAPLAHAEEWDNVGLLAGDPDAPLARVLLCIDCTRDVVLEAERAECSAIVAYHPPLFRPVSRVTRGSIVYELVRRGLALYSPHTALDAAEGGTNDALADAIGMTSRGPLRAAAAKDIEHKLVTFVPPGALARVSDALFEAGAGRVGDYRACSFRTPGTGTFYGDEGTRPAVGSAPQTHETVDGGAPRRLVPDRSRRGGDRQRASRVAPVGACISISCASPRPSQDDGARHGSDRGPRADFWLEALVARIKERLGVAHVLLAGPTERTISRAAVCAGAAGDLLDAAMRGGAEVIVAGEVRHHDALRAAEAGVTVVCALHSNSERIALEPLRARIAAALPGLALATSRAATSCSCWLGTASSGSWRRETSQSRKGPP